MTIENVTSFFDLLSSIVTIAGVPIAIVLFYREKKRERIAREENTFDALDDKYVDFMRLCLEHQGVDVFETPMDDERVVTSAGLQAESALFAILISLFERAFVMFEGQHTDFRQRQWKGWVLFMESYAHRKSYQRVWKEIGAQFDSAFGQFMNEMTGVNKSSSPG